MDTALFAPDTWYLPGVEANAYQQIMFTGGTPVESVQFDRLTTDATATPSSVTIRPLAANDVLAEGTYRFAIDEHQLALAITSGVDAADAHNDDDGPFMSAELIEQFHAATDSGADSQLEIAHKVLAYQPHFDEAQTLNLPLAIEGVDYEVVRVPGVPPHPMDGLYAHMTEYEAEAPNAALMLRVTTNATDCDPEYDLAIFEPGGGDHTIFVGMGDGDPTLGFDSDDDAFFSP